MMREIENTANFHEIKEMDIFEGDVVVLSGISRHGKNRIRENGHMWRVISLDGKDSSILSTKVCVRPLELDRVDNWRWIALPEDRDMRIEDIL